MIDENKLIEAFHKWDMQDLYLPVHFEMLINEQPKVGEWIPVSERLPEEDGIYLVQFKSGNLYTCRYCEGWNCNRDHITGNVNRGLEVFTVVAWMPLPEPYRGEKV